MSANFFMPMNEIDVHQLASVIRSNTENVLIIDSRSFTEYNACHILSSVNIGYSKVVKRKLQQDKLSVKELLIHTCNCDVDEKLDVVVYDQSNKNWNSLPPDSFIVILIKKLQLSFRSINLLTGGFEEFQKYYQDLCEERFRKCPSYASLSQPCLPLTNQGPTRILPFLYLGTQLDAMNQELLKDCNITYEMNVSTNCPQPDFLPEGHFMRIPVNDTYTEKILPYFPQAFNFLDKVREGSSCVLVNCLAGISRSPTIVIGYVMRHLHLSSDDGYRYVKSKRPTISPNFNFLGQLLEYEKELRAEDILEPESDTWSELPDCNQKRLCKTDMRKLSLSLDINEKVNENAKSSLPRKEDHSPTSALAKLSFDASTTEESRPSFSNFGQLRSRSCYGDWLRSYSDTSIERKTNEVPAASKVLSPVKEIKCDGLISEISTGYSDTCIKAKDTVRQRISDFNSLHAKSYEFQKSSENSPRSKKTKSSESRKYKWQIEDKKEYNSFIKSNTKVNSYIPHVRSSENLYQAENNKLKSVGSQDQYPYHKNKPVHYSLSLNSDLHKLSDPSSSSTFAKRNLNDRALNFNQMSNMYHEKDIFNSKILRSSCTASKKDYFSSIFGDKNLTRNSSDPDHHFLDDNTDNVEIRNNNTDSSPFIGSKYSSQSSTSFQDSGAVASSMCTWSRKRGADFDMHLVKSGRNTAVRDKRKYEPFKKSFSSNFMEENFFCEDKELSSVRAFHPINQGNNRLYRAQSCPVILCSESTSNKLDYVINEFPLHKKSGRDICSLSPSMNGAQKELSCHESCPDVLNLGVDNFLALKSHRQRAFRKNIRMAKAS